MAEGNVTPIRATSDPRFNASMGHPGSTEGDDETVPISGRVAKSVLARIDEWVQGGTSSIKTRAAFLRAACEHFLETISEHAEDPAMKARMQDVVNMLRVDNLLSTYEDFLSRVRAYEERIGNLILGHLRDVHNPEYAQFPIDLLESIEEMCGELPEPYAGHLRTYCRDLLSAGGKKVVVVDQTP